MNSTEAQTMFRQAWSRRHASSITVVQLELTTVIFFFVQLIVLSFYCDEIL